MGAAVSSSTLPSRLEALPRGGLVVLGNFDGVHRGHRAVVERALARAAGGRVRALTFEPHPRSFFAPDRPVWRLTPEALKRRELLALGLADVIALPFDATLAGLDAEAFVRQVLVEGLSVDGVVCGHDFHFGRGRGGSPAVLAELGRRHGFSVDVVAPFLDEGGVPVSSSRIRDALANRDPALAAGLLGRPFSVVSEIVHGDKRGRVLGYPTANMALPAETGLAHGVYAVRVTVDGVRYDGAANFGRRPQFGSGPVLLESFLFDFSGDLYGRVAEVAFHAFLRPEARFDGVEALIAQMDRDCAEARALLAAA